MQVANTLNNTIRILFNPKLEAFKLFDFLMVKSDSSKYIAQIIEIYDDKFDASQNVAKLKLFYRITENNEVMPYDNFTPNKECEISKIKPEEIETFINQDKETFILGTNVKNSSALNVQYDFFNKNAVILADKVESITFTYAHYDDDGEIEWLEYWDQDDENYTNVLPLAYGFTIVFESGETLSYLRRTAGLSAYTGMAL